MASIEPRTNANGVTVYRLKWRYGGKRNGTWQSVTYGEHDAKSM